VFNQLTPAEVVTAIGVTARGAARHQGELSDFGRDQLMSVYSATRHLTAELATYEPTLTEFTASVARSLRACPDPELRAALSPHAERIEVAGDAATLGTEVGDLLTALRAYESDGAAALLTETHTHLRSLADREVDLVADGLG
jgi:hypothetical protein